MTLSHQFGKALLYATRIHGGQLRKKTRIPYIAHILGVTAIAMEYGATETEAIGALLHDAVEDCGGAKRLHDIERKFGKAVAKIVEGCTDTARKLISPICGTRPSPLRLCRLRTNCITSAPSSWITGPSATNSGVGSTAGKKARSGITPRSSKLFPVANASLPFSLSSIAP